MSLNDVLLSLPVIPLATNDPLSSFSHPPNSRRGFARSTLGLSKSAFVVLFVGRLSFHSKSHPLPLYRALNNLSASFPSREIVLIECGHIFSQQISDAYKELQHSFPHIKFRLLGGLQPASDLDKQLALAAADTFVSSLTTFRRPSVSLLLKLWQLLYLLSFLTGMATRIWLLTGCQASRFRQLFPPLLLLHMILLICLIP